MTRWKVNIKMGPKEGLCEGMDGLFCLDIVHAWDLVSTIMYPWITLQARIF